MGQVILHLPEKPAEPHPGDLFWIERIEAIRAEEAPPTCPTCGHAVTSVLRVCADCKQPKPLRAFSIKIRRTGQLQVYCRSCQAARMRVVRANNKRAAFRQILGRSA